MMDVLHKSSNNEGGSRPKGRLAVNTALNLLGQLLPLITGIVAMPFIVRGLGQERFGVLGIVWVVFGYFALFDLGLGRATTKFLAEYLAEERVSEIPRFVWSSLALQVVFGIAAAAVLVAVTPTLVRLLRVPTSLVEETKVTLWILGAALPVVLVANGLRAVLEGCQRFDLTNILKIPGNALVFVIPAMALPFGLKLPAVVLLLLISRLGLVLAHLILCLKVLPTLRHGFVLESRSVIPLLTYGGWVTVASVVNPVLIYLDRFLIAYFLSVSMVGYYTAPFESVTRLWIIPASLATTIFPACSTLGVSQKDQLGYLYSRSMKYLFVILAPITLLIVVFAREIITFWLGAGFAVKSSAVLQILALGVFFNSFAHIPYSFLQALGRPDAPAKLLLAELPIYGFSAWLLIYRFGIVGAASAWSIRVALESLVLCFLAWKLFTFSPLFSAGGVRVSTGALIGVSFVAGCTILLFGSFWAQIGAATVWILCFAIACWRFAFDDSDRASVLSVVNPLLSLLRSRGAA